MREFFIVIDNTPHGVHCGPVNTWTTEEEARKVVDFWLKNKVSWAHNVTTENTQEVTTKSNGKNSVKIITIYHYKPKTITIGSREINVHKLP